jgi:hypothetical protein
MGSVCAVLATVLPRGPPTPARGSMAGLLEAPGRQKGMGSENKGTPENKGWWGVKWLVQGVKCLVSSGMLQHGSSCSLLCERGCGFRCIQSTGAVCG